MGSLGTDIGNADDTPQIKWMTAGAGHIIFDSTHRLEPDAPNNNDTKIYDRSPGGPTHYVSQLPGGAIGGNTQFQGASQDGTAVAFFTNSSGNVTSTCASTTPPPRRSPATTASRSASSSTCTGGGSGGATLSYQWLRNGNPIGGATSATYTTVAADAGAEVQCQVAGDRRRRGRQPQGQLPAGDRRALADQAAQAQRRPLDLGHRQRRPGADLRQRQLGQQPHPDLLLPVVPQRQRDRRRHRQHLHPRRGRQGRRGAVRGDRDRRRRQSRRLLEQPADRSAAAERGRRDPDRERRSGDLQPHRLRPTRRRQATSSPATPGTWAASPTFTYQWLRNGAAIGGATSATYATTTPDDDGATLQCRVTATTADSVAQAVSNRVVADPQPGTTPPDLRLGRLGQRHRRGRPDADLQRRQLVGQPHLHLPVAAKRRPDRR